MLRRREERGVRFRDGIVFFSLFSSLNLCGMLEIVLWPLVSFLRVLVVVRIRNEDGAGVTL